MCLVFKLVKLEPQNKNRMSFCGLGCSLGAISLLSRVQRGQEQTEICVNDVRFKLVCVTFMYVGKAFEAFWFENIIGFDIYLENWYS